MQANVPPESPQNGSRLGWSERNKLTSLCLCVDANPWYLPVKTCEAGRALFKSPLGIATFLDAVVEQGHATVTLVDSHWDAFCSICVHR